MERPRGNRERSMEIGVKRNRVMQSEKESERSRRMRDEETHPIIVGVDKWRDEEVLTAMAILKKGKFSVPNDGGTEDLSLIVRCSLCPSKYYNSVHISDFPANLFAGSTWTLLTVCRHTPLSSRKRNV